MGFQHKLFQYTLLDGFKVLFYSHSKHLSFEQLTEPNNYFSLTDPI